MSGIDRLYLIVAQLRDCLDQLAIEALEGDSGAHARAALELGLIDAHTALTLARLLDATGETREAQPVEPVKE